jgi:carbamoyl-phosphate synthase small subunit
VPGVSGERQRAMLAFEDGTVFEGWSCGAPGEVTGEIVFNTSMTGYQEVFTDPSYAGQIVTMTSPHIGNYGVNAADMESRGVFASGFVVRELSATASNWRAEETVAEFLVRLGVVAIEGVDTRRLTRHVRGAGAMRSVLSTLDLDAASLIAKAQAAPSLVGVDLVSGVGTPQAYTWGGEMPPECDIPVDTGILQGAPRYRVVAFDSGIKYNILRRLADAGCEIIVVPPTTTADEALAMECDGVFFANGPGDPAAVSYLYETVAAVLGKKPVFGICLGHQMLALALGARTYKLKYGHRGGNQPVKNLITGQVEITTQNHGFCVDFGSIGELDVAESGGLAHDANDLAAWVRAGVAPVVRSARFGRVQLTHVNLNDMTTAGVRCLDVPAVSVQYHPEAAPGPFDARYLFSVYARLMDGRDDIFSETDGA